MFAIFEKDQLQWTILAVSVLFFLINGVHYLSQRSAQPRQFFYIRKTGIAGWVLKIWSAILPVALVAGFITGKRTMATLAPLFFIFVNVIAIIFRMKARREGQKRGVKSEA